MKIYAVGGQVRDQLLHFPIKDRDFVVVGSTPEEMINQGYTQVGASFPVFLKNGEEYALARTERKSGVGYKGFVVNFDSNITLVEDLSRRDLTINSMAQDPDTGEIIDPFGGKDDLYNGILRHTSQAFAEDPIRVLRTARFAARYGFVVHADTIELMENIVHELDHVPQERIWAEFEKGIMEKHPERMFMILNMVGAFKVDALKPYGGVNVQKLVSLISTYNIAALFSAVGTNFTDADYERCRIPTECAKVSKYINRFGDTLMNFHNMKPRDRLTVLTDMKTTSQTTFVMQLLQILSKQDPLADRAVNQVVSDILTIDGVDVSYIAAKYKKGEDIKKAIFDERLFQLEQSK